MNNHQQVAAFAEANLVKGVSSLTTTFLCKSKRLLTICFCLSSCRFHPFTPIEGGIKPINPGLELIYHSLLWLLHCLKSASMCQPYPVGRIE